MKIIANKQNYFMNVKYLLSTFKKKGRINRPLNKIF